LGKTYCEREKGEDKDGHWDAETILHVTLSDVELIAQTLLIDDLVYKKVGEEGKEIARSGD
jgi:hypothetical protein